MTEFIRHIRTVLREDAAENLKRIADAHLDAPYPWLSTPYGCSCGEVFATEDERELHRTSQR